MENSGYDAAMIAQLQILAEAPKKEGREWKKSRYERNKCYPARAQVTNVNKEGGSGTVSIKNQADYKRYAEEARDNLPQKPSKYARGKGSPTSSAAGDRWQESGKKGWKSNSWSSSSSWWNSSGGW